jgi:ligand-binding SRPBCC domain-containing protein
MINAMNVMDVSGAPRSGIDRRVRTLYLNHRLPLSLADTFAFFERPENLALITPPWLGLRLLTSAPITMAAGLTLDYRVRIFGVPRPWRSLIREYDPPHGFRDVQVIGPYLLWDHRHRFRPERSGTLIEDLVVYEPPLGPIGSLLDRFVIRRRLEQIFAYRRRRIEALLVEGVRQRQ